MLSLEDSTLYWIEEEHELTPFSFEIASVVNYPDGIRRGEIPAQGMDPEINDHYRYCEDITTEGLDFYCLQPIWYVKNVVAYNQ